MFKPQCNLIVFSFCQFVVYFLALMSGLVTSKMVEILSLDYFDSFGDFDLAADYHSSGCDQARL